MLKPTITFTFDEACDKYDSIKDKAKRHGCGSLNDAIEQGFISYEEAIAIAWHITGASKLPAHQFWLEGK
jgi:hypothetical protein